MEQPLQMFGVAALTLSLAGSAYLVLAGLQVRRFRTAPAQPVGAFPSVTVLKPLCGADSGLEDALATLLAQDYPGPIQIVFGLQDSADPAFAIVRRLQRARPDADVAVVVDGRLHGPNRKGSNLINRAPDARGKTLGLSDSDILVQPDYLRRVVAPLADPAV